MLRFLYVILLVLAMGTFDFHLGVSAQSVLLNKFSQGYLQSLYYGVSAQSVPLNKFSQENRTGVICAREAV